MNGMNGVIMKLFRYIRKGVLCVWIGTPYAMMTMQIINI